MSALLAGVARRVISPPPGIFLIGYGDRTKGNIGIHDDLTATALIFDSGKIRLGIVALDILTMNEYIVDRIRARFPEVNLLICCSHTHSGPIAYADSRSPARNQAYMNSLVQNVAMAVEEASTGMVPVHLEYSAGEADIAINRREKQPDGHFEIGRDPNGIVDRSVQVVGVFRDSATSGKAGKDTMRLATLVNYACHGTVLGPDNLLVSADWIGVMRSKVEAELGGLALFLQGATANLNPDMYWNQPKAFEMMTEQGLRVAKSVLTASKAIEQELIQGLPLLMERKEAWLPTEIPAITPRPPRNYAKSLLAMAKMPAFMVFLADHLLDQRYPWKPRIEAREGYWCVPMRITGVRLGDLALVTFAAETFTEIGMTIKANSPARHTLFASITDGCVSYLHTAASHSEGGYEVDTAPLAYRYPGRLSVECEKLSLDGAQSILQRLWTE